jgi:hypothetical protein
MPPLRNSSSEIQERETQPEQKLETWAEPTTQLASAPPMGPPPKFEYTTDDVDLSHIYVVPIKYVAGMPLFRQGTNVPPELIARLEHKYRGHPLVTVKTQLGSFTLSLCEVITTLGINI